MQKIRKVLRKQRSFRIYLPVMKQESKNRTREAGCGGITSVCKNGSIRAFALASRWKYNCQ